MGHESVRDLDLAARYAASCPPPGRRRWSRELRRAAHHSPRCRASAAPRSGRWSAAAGPGRAPGPRGSHAAPDPMPAVRRRAAELAPALAPPPVVGLLAPARATRTRSSRRPRRGPSARSRGPGAPGRRVVAALASRPPGAPGPAGPGVGGRRARRDRRRPRPPGDPRRVRATARRSAGGRCSRSPRSTVPRSTPRSTHALDRHRLAGPPGRRGPARSRLRGAPAGRRRVRRTGEPRSVDAGAT